MIDTLVIATHNPGKVPEIAALLAGRVRQFTTAAELGLPEPEETGATFADNAILKAEAAAAASGLPSLADDSGLCVDALDGEPGVYSARYMKAQGGFPQAMQAIHDRLAGGSARRASFVCVLALGIPGRPTLIFEGVSGGNLVWPPRGDGGFGYDPMFQPDGHDRTYGEMSKDEKRAISHRTLAFAKLAAHLRLMAC